VASFDGSSGYAATSKSVVDPTGSFTVSVWVKPSAPPAGSDGTVLGQDGTSNSAFYLQYNDTCCDSPGWALSFPESDTASPAWYPTTFAAGATAGTWTLLTGVYNAATGTAQLYVNGSLAATSSGIMPFTAAGAFTIGRGLYNGASADFFPGEVSDVQVFSQALSAVQVQALSTEGVQLLAG
jgi:hypothetical protein